MRINTCINWCLFLSTKQIDVEVDTSKHIIAMSDILTASDDRVSSSSGKST